MTGFEPQFLGEKSNHLTNTYHNYQDHVSKCKPADLVDFSAQAGAHLSVQSTRALQVFHLE